MNIKYRGDGVSHPSLQVPGWAGGITNDTTQPWHTQTFVDAATSGIDLSYIYEDVEIPDIQSPFIKVTDMYYLLETEIALVTPDKHSLLVLPHYRFYTDASWSTPIPVATMVDVDWWPGRLAVMFRMPPPGCKTLFRKGEPFAQAMVVSRSSLKLEEMSEEEVQRKEEAKVYMMKDQKFITREWTTSSGYKQDNLYEVLRHLERRNQLPAQIKSRPKYRVIK